MEELGLIGPKTPQGYRSWTSEEPAQDGTFEVLTLANKLEAGLSFCREKGSQSHPHRTAAGCRP